MENLKFINDLGSSDFESWILVQDAYRTNAWKETIVECGFNKNVGYVYITLENGVTITSCFGQNVEYVAYDSEQEEETLFDDYQSALKCYEVL